MGRLSREYLSRNFEDAFHELKAKEYDLQKKLVDAVLIHNYVLADKIKTELRTTVPPCSDEDRILLEKGRGKFVGQCFLHKKNGYRGVIFKADCKCRMDDSWIQMMGVDSLERGRNQPFYHCLADCHDRPGAQTTYVAEDNVSPAGDAFPVDHPWMDSLFIAVPELKCYVGTERLHYVLTDYDD